MLNIWRESTQDEKKKVNFYEYFLKWPANFFLFEQAEDKGIYRFHNCQGLVTAIWFSGSGPSSSSPIMHVNFDNRMYILTKDFFIPADKYENCELFVTGTLVSKSGVYGLRNGGKMALLNKSGGLATDFYETEDDIRSSDFDSFFYFIDGYAIVKNNKKEGVLNEVFDVIIPCNYDNIWKEANLKNTWVVTNENKCGLYGINGKLTECIYDVEMGYKTFHFNQNQSFAIVKKNGKYGCINDLGIEFIPCIFDYIRPELLIATLIYVEINGKVGVFDTNGNAILKPNYELSDFK